MKAVYCTNRFFLRVLAPTILTCHLTWHVWVDCEDIVFFHVGETPWMARLICSCIWFGWSPCPVTATTRTVIFLVGDPYKPSFATVVRRGDNPIYSIYEKLTSSLNWMCVSKLRCWSGNFESESPNVIDAWKSFCLIHTLRIMGSQNWWFGDPRTLLYRVKPLYKRVQWFLGHDIFFLSVLKDKHICSKCIKMWWGFPPNVCPKN